MKLTIYEPVLKPTGKSTEKCWCTVNGAKSSDIEEAIRLANQHISVRDGRMEIGRVDTFEVDAEDWHRKRYYW